MYVREKSVDFKSFRVSRLDDPQESTLHVAVLLTRIWDCEFAVGSETVAVINQRRVGVFGAVVGPERSWDSHVGHKTFHHTENGGCALVPGPARVLEAWSAVHEHYGILRGSK